MTTEPNEPTEPVMTDQDDDAADQDIEGRFPEAVRDDDDADVVANEHADETDPAIPPPQATNG